MQLSPTGDLEANGIFQWFTLQGNIGKDLPLLPVIDMAGGNIFPLLAGKGRIIGNKIH